MLRAIATQVFSCSILFWPRKLSVNNFYSYSRDVGQVSWCVALFLLIRRGVWSKRGCDGFSPTLQGLVCVCRLTREMFTDSTYSCQTRLYIISYACVLDLWFLSRALSSVSRHRCPTVFLFGFFLVVNTFRSTFASVYARGSESCSELSSSHCFLVPFG